jgi:hypothetical protein
MSLKIIGTGFGRTGTDSMRMALNMLGFGPTHHMFELSDKPILYKRWIDLAHGAQPDWDGLFEGYLSCVDWPSAYYWRQLIDVYPDARVLLTWRSPESWWKSFKNTLLETMKRPKETHPLAHFIAKNVFNGKPDDRDHAIDVYKRHVDEVIDTTAQDRLLVYKLGEGWEPLCTFLGVSVPKQDYPNKNDTLEFRTQKSIPDNNGI